MEIVIKIPDKMYEDAKNGKDTGESWYITQVIKNGTPLPKRHGDLIDRNALITELETDYHGTLTESGAHLFVGITNYIDDAETIIEADKETDNE